MKAKRKAAGFLLLHTWRVMDGFRIMTMSYMERDLEGALTDKEMEFLSKRMTVIKNANEGMRKLAWRLVKSS